MQPTYLPVHSTGHYRALLACLILFTVVIGNNFNADANFNVNLNSNLASLKSNLDQTNLVSNQVHSDYVLKVFTSLLHYKNVSQDFSTPDQVLILPVSLVNLDTNNTTVISNFSINLRHSIYTAAP